MLVIDGSPEGDDGFYLRNALSPGGRNLGGWTPQVEPASFLRRHERLADYAAICLLDVARLDDPEVAALENYVKGGGGLAIFLGPRGVAQLLQRPAVPRRRGPAARAARRARRNCCAIAAAAPDVRVTDHPVFRVFAGERNSFLSVAKVDFYYGIDPLWQLPASGDVQVIARLRNGAPLFVEKKLGDGRVVVGLVKLSPKPTEPRRVEQPGAQPRVSRAGQRAGGLPLRDASGGTTCTASTSRCELDRRGSEIPARGARATAGGCRRRRRRAIAPDGGRRPVRDQDAGHAAQRRVAVRAHHARGQARDAARRGERAGGRGRPAPAAASGAGRAAARHRLRVLAGVAVHRDATTGSQARGWPMRCSTRCSRRWSSSSCLPSRRATIRPRARRAA